MAKQIAVGVQDFEKLRSTGSFYVDKTAFIKEWWDSNDDVTLITRPRRFGKTLNVSMLNCFFSNKYLGRSDLFEGLNIWNNDDFRKLQGTFPVVSVTFAGVKGVTISDTISGIKKQIVRVFSGFPELYTYSGFDNNEKSALSNISEDMKDIDAAYSLNLLSALLEKMYKKKVLIFLDEYDTPLLEAYINGYWDELVAFIRTMFNNTFKTNPSLNRAIMTGITRVSKESIFSDLNNLNVITTTSNEYATSFGFTEREVFEAMDSQGIAVTEKKNVKFWYDGFTFGKIADIYNPWSVIMYLNKQEYDTYWANTSANSLVGKLIREGDKGVKTEFEKLISGEYIETSIDEQIVFNQLSGSKESIWSLLLASGYLKVIEARFGSDMRKPYYKLALTNHEVKCMFEKMVEDWFNQDTAFGDFVTAMFKGDVRGMNGYMNEVALNTFSYFDTGNKPSDRKSPERFYHGFVLGLLVDRVDTHVVKSNRESGYGRYDVIMEPKSNSDKAVIMEFKVFDKEDNEKELTDTASNALKQIEDMKYDSDLLARGIPSTNIYKYGFAFEGEKCLILKG
ncbi:MAG: ATP-binding protein [Lachnospiraceae bacterium]|nr:ATP-binding protein [Lachnospiraceae bacterium]